MHGTPEMIEKAELARLVRRFEQYNVEPKRGRKAIRKDGIELALVIEQAHALRALACFHNQLQRPCIEPSLPLADQLRDSVFTESAGVLLA